MSSKRSFPIKYKVALIGIGGVLITAVALMLLVVVESAEYDALAQKEVNSIIDTHLNNIAQGIYFTVKTENDAVRDKLQTDIAVARTILAYAGGLQFTNTQTSWTAINQFTKAAAAIQLPQALLQGSALEPNTDPAVATPVVDQIARLTGGTVTLFQRMNEQGDMLRIATTVTEANGRRAIATCIPATDPDGSPNPVIASVLNAGTFEGRAWVVNAWYLTAYEAIKDARGRVVGMLYVGIPQKTVEDRIRKVVVETVIGKSGYVYIIVGKGQNRGAYIISHKGERDGENVWNIQDSDGRHIIQDIIRTAVQLKPRELAAINYRWQNPDESTPQRKIARVAYFEPWDWVIGASVTESELQVYRNYLTEGRRKMTTTMTYATVAIVLVITAAASLLAWRITRPIQSMTHSVRAFLHGHCQLAALPATNDEVGILSRAFNQMIESLNQTLKHLKASEAKYRSIFENAMEGVFQTTPEGKFLSVNPYMAAMLGYPSAEELKAAISDIGRQCYLRPEDRTLLLRDLHANGSVASRDLPFRRRDGEVIWGSLTAQMIRDEQGRPQYIEGFLADITARKQAEQDREKLEEQLLQAKKMESVGRLAGGVAHDFNNMLSVILGHLEMALATVGSAHPLHADLLEVQKAAQRSAELTRQLLAFARKQTVTPQVLDLNITLGGMLNMLRRLIGEDIELAWTPAKELWFVKMDPSQLDQVLANLCVNARDAIASHGRITIKTRNLSCDETSCAQNPGMAPGDYVVLTVSDTGCGISHDLLPHVFEPFFTTKKTGTGTGLGLATVYGAIKQNKGFINVYSEPGHGTVFRIYLPRHVTDPADASPARQSQPAEPGHETILLVEDEPAILKMTTAMLSRLGYTVLAAPGPEAALGIARTHQGKIHLLLTDVIMPNMNGRELSRLIVSSHPDIRYVFMSGYTADIISRQGVLEDGVDFIQKPFGIRDLARKLREVLASPAP